MKRKRRYLPLCLLCLLLTNCGIGDIGSESNQTSTNTNTDNSENNGIFTTSFSCQFEAADGGFIVQTIDVTGAIQQGPDFFEELPEDCATIEEGAEETIIVESSPQEPSNGFNF